MRHEQRLTIKQQTMGLGRAINISAMMKAGNDMPIEGVSRILNDTDAYNQLNELFIEWGKDFGHDHSVWRDIEEAIVERFIDSEP